MHSNEMISRLTARVLGGIARGRKLTGAFLASTLQAQEGAGMDIAA